MWWTPQQQKTTKRQQKHSTCSTADLKEALKLLQGVAHDYPAEQAAAAFSAIGLITQIALLAIVIMQKTIFSGGGAGAPGGDAQPAATT